MIWTFKYLLMDFVYNVHFFVPFAILYINLNHKESLLLKHGSELFHVA